MKIAFIIFNGITWMDLIGIYEPVQKLKSLEYLPDLQWDFCGYTKEVADYGGLSVIPTEVRNDLSGYDAIIVPGGRGTRELIQDTDFITWLQTATNVKYKIAVCSGSLLLGAAGFLKNKKATTHYDEYDTLKPFCQEVKTERVVVDGTVITAGAVTSAIDLGLHLCREWGNDEASVVIRYKMDYRN